MTGRKRSAGSMSRPASPRSSPPAGSGRHPDGDDGEQSGAKRVRRAHVSSSAADEGAGDDGEEHQRDDHTQNPWLGSSFTPLNDVGGNSHDGGLGADDSVERALYDALGAEQSFESEFGHLVHADDPVVAGSASSPTSPTSLPMTAFSSSQSSSWQQQAPIQQQAPYQQQQAPVQNQAPYQQQQAPIQQQAPYQQQQAPYQRQAPYQQQASIQPQQLQYQYQYEFESPVEHQPQPSPHQQSHGGAQQAVEQTVQQSTPHQQPRLPAQQPGQQQSVQQPAPRGQLHLPAQQPAQQPQQQQGAPTGAQVVTAAYGSAVRIDSVLCRRLAAEPALREPVQRRAEQKLNIERRSNVEALLAHVTGQVAARPCKNCHKGHGPWTQCVVYGGQMCGSCSNCWFNASGARCTFHENNNPQPQQQQQRPRPAAPQPTQQQQPANSYQQHLRRQQQQPPLATPYTRPPHRHIVTAISSPLTYVAPAAPLAANGIGLDHLSGNEIAQWRMADVAHRTTARGINGSRAVSRRLRLIARIEAAAKELGVRIAEFDEYVSSPEGIAEDEERGARQQDDDDAASIGQYEPPPPPLSSTPPPQHHHDHHDAQRRGE